MSDLAIVEAYQNEPGQFDYLDTSNAALAMDNSLASMGDHLKELKMTLLETEAKYEAAKKEYEYYASSVLPMAMFNAGVEEIKLLSGGVMKYQRKFYCTPNKNEADRQVQADWLREHNLANIIKEKASVDGAQLDKLKQSGIPFTEINDINTTTLKSQLMDLIGAKGGTPQIQITDIPACFHFQEVGEVSITM